jgi:predicted RNA binding protein YcfA (HicA-like mRNA interferase family)
MIHPQKRRIIPIPTHSGRDIGVGLLRQIIREAGITPEEWNRL